VPATTSPPTRAPNNDIQVEPVSWSSSSNSHLAALAFDHEESTAFVTQMQVGAPPTWAWVMADLGRAVQLSGIEWLWSAAGANDDVTIRTSPDGATWTTHLQVGGGAAGVWLGTDLTATARYVRFYFHNPNGDPQVGQLGEVRILATPTATGLSDPIIRVPVITGPTMETGDVTVLPPDTGNPPVGTRLTSIKARRSANSAIGSSTLALDSNPNSAWSTAMSVPPWNGWVSFDLGATTPLRTIQWTIAQPDAADSYRVQISANGSTWTTVAVLTNPTGANQWQTLPVEVDARYVRFYFRNPNLDANIGQLSDVRFYAP
jgi:F5/8 type C domain